MKKQAPIILTNFGFSSHTTENKPMLTFNQQGYLEPFNIIETNLATFEQTFVFNDHRRVIFEEYLLFLDALTELKISPFYQWINGSFVTKKLRPNDLDVVSFVDYPTYESNENHFFNLRYKFRSRKIDNYFVAVYPSDHKEFSLFENYRLDYFHNFTRDYKQELRLNKKLPKAL